MRLETVTIGTGVDMTADCPNVLQTLRRTATRTVSRLRGSPEVKRLSQAPSLRALAQLTHHRSCASRNLRLLAIRVLGSSRGCPLDSTFDSSRMPARGPTPPPICCPVDVCEGIRAETTALGRESTSLKAASLRSASLTIA